MGVMEHRQMNKSEENKSVKKDWNSDNVRAGLKSHRKFVQTVKRNRNPFAFISNNSLSLVYCTLY